MEIVDNAILLLKSRDPHKVPSVIPKSRVIDQRTVAVHWGLHEVRVLRNLGFKDIPSPILRSYGWPCRYPSVFAHQKQTAAFLTLNRRAFVLSEPGTGKTLSALWAADYLMDLGLVRRVLIVCPLSIMHSAWLGDIGRSVIHRSAIVCHHSSADRRKEIIRGNYEIVVTNYDGVKIVADAINKNGEFDLIIADEASYLKTHTTDRWKTFASIIRSDSYLWLMTGTPAAQAPTDAYGLAKLVSPTLLPSSFRQWQERVMNKITNFKWAPKKDAAEQVHKVLQPAIRFTKAQCLDLPPVLTETRIVEMTPQQMKYYRMIKDRAVAEAAGETISAPTAAAVVSKLLQVSCICYNTPVLTNLGWVPIQDVDEHMRVWDGVEWVSHSGVVNNGCREVVECYGVLMTRDHRVLTTDGWHTAMEVLDGKSSVRFNRKSVRLPNSGGTLGDYRRNSNAVRPMALPLPMWHIRCPPQPVLTSSPSGASSQLRVPPWQRIASDVTHSPLQNLGRHAQEMYRSTRQRLEKLWGAWHQSVSQMANVVRGVLGGHATRVQAASNAGANRQQQRILLKELSLGNYRNAKQQYAEQQVYQNKVWSDDNSTGRKALWVCTKHVVRADSSVRLERKKGAGNARKAQVFDIVNCGPRNRFVVQGVDGQPLIVHNCGTAYSDDHETVQFDCKTRMRAIMDVIDQTDRKVLIFALFRSSITTIVEHLEKEGVSCGEIHGGVTASERGRIIKAFQETDSPRVLVLQPQAAAHGITLTAADTVVFYGPLMSVEQYVQCCARADRQGQTSDKVTVIHIQSSSIESKMFQALSGKVADHRLLTDMFESEIKEGLTTKK